MSRPLTMSAEDEREHRMDALHDCAQNDAAVFAFREVDAERAEHAATRKELAEAEARLARLRPMVRAAVCVVSEPHDEKPYNQRTCFRRCCGCAAELALHRAEGDLTIADRTWALSDEPQEGRDE